MFTLHPRLESDTFLIQKLDICGVYLMNDKRYPWLILVPELEDKTELHELNDSDYAVVCDEIKRVSKSLARLCSPKKINIGALGNMVPQLHIHVIARYEEDAAWPGPVWGVGQAAPFSLEEKTQRVEDIQKNL